MRILIAEDERITRLSLQRQLEKWGHQVYAAEDGVVAWGQFQNQEFDIIVTDWDMPNMDGCELIRHIRSNDRSSYVYVIMLTARSDTNDLVSGMEAGADDFLSKPFDRNELRVRLNAGERIIQLERGLAEKNQKLLSANKKMKRDLVAAAKVQQDLLPKETPDKQYAEFAWHYEPCEELGGDILNMFMLDSHHIGMYLIDVSGHGVSAALLSVSLSRVLTASDRKTSILLSTDQEDGKTCIRSPRDVAALLNKQFPMESQNYHYFTMCYAVFNTKTLQLQYVLAGHPAPILMQKNQLPRQIEGSGLPVGVTDDALYDQYSIQLQPGDRICLFSDGITEAENNQQQMLEEDGLIKLIGRTCTKSLQTNLDECVRDLKQWCSPVTFKDDVSLLMLEVPELN